MSHFQDPRKRGAGRIFLHTPVCGVPPKHCTPKRGPSRRGILAPSSAVSGKGAAVMTLWETGHENEKQAHFSQNQEPVA